MAKLAHKLSYRDRVIATALALAILALIGLAWGLTTSILADASTHRDVERQNPYLLRTLVDIKPGSVEWSTFVQPYVTQNPDGSYSITFQIYVPWPDRKPTPFVQGYMTGAYSGWELDLYTSFYDPYDPWGAGPAFYVYGPLERRSDGSIAEWIRFTQCDGVFWEQDNTGKTLWKRYCIIPLEKQQLYTISITVAQSPTSQYEYELTFEIGGKRIVAIVKHSANSLQRILEYTTSYYGYNAHVYPGPPFPKIYAYERDGTKVVRASYAPLTLALPALDGYTYRVSPPEAALREEDGPGPFRILYIDLAPAIFDPVTTQVCTSQTSIGEVPVPDPPLNPTTTRWVPIYSCVGYSTSTKSYTAQITLEAFDQQGNLVASLNINLDDILQQLGLDQGGDNRLVYAAIAILVITFILVMRGGRR